LHPRVLFSIALCCAPLAIAAAQHFDPDEATLSSVRPRIPEPMVFDLVRPLGAARGEFEVNSLFRLAPSGSPRRLLWAPEVEYTFADGHGVEFELPLENGEIASYKAALQGTLPGPAETNFIQGWQVLGEVERDRSHWQLDIMYLAGAKLSRRWSVFSMTGVRREQARQAAYAFLGNYSGYYSPRRSLTVGFESNWISSAAATSNLLLMPQVHWRKTRYNLQFGTGLNRLPGESTLMLSWRLSREF
jgi:hypothetical protein